MDGAELEIKFAVSEPRLFDIIIADPQLLLMAKHKKPITQNYEALYYDTPDFALRKAGISYRIRKEGADWIATFKSDSGSSGSLFSREEWNEKVSGPEASRKPFDGTFAGERMVKKTGNQRLQLLFSTNFSRTTLQLETSSGAMIEIALDRGTIWSGSGTAQISELEIELKKGKTSQLLELAAWIAPKWNLLPENRSKYVRGIELLEFGSTSEGISSHDISVTLTAIPTLTSLVDHCAADMFRAQAFLLADGASPKSIRELRIQCRRLRSVLRFFQSQFKKDEWDLQVDQLRRWGTLLGTIRDIDVLHKAWHSFVSRFNPVTIFSEHWPTNIAERRYLLAEDVIQLLNRGELTKFLFEMQAWIYRRQEEWSAGGEGNDISGFIQKGLIQATKSLKADIDSINAFSSIERFHRLRIKIKRVRYVQESVMRFSPFRADNYIDTLILAQTAIGKIHDAYQIKYLLDQVETGNLDENFLLEKELFVSWRSRMITDRIFGLLKILGNLRKESKNHLRSLNSLRVGKWSKSAHDSDPHEPGK